MGTVRCLKVSVLVLVLAVAPSACGKTKSTSASTGGGTTVEAYDFRFDPKVLNVKAGQKVTLMFKNEGKTEHNFSVTSLSVDQEAQPGTTQTVTFTAPGSAGDVQFFCKYHKDSHNMVGTLHVSAY
jgi:plastocyanin